jgi:8-amino-7-oxononanoate synthase
MHSAALERYQTVLLGLSSQSRLRTLEPRSGLDFSSNDYLGLATSARLGLAINAAIARGTAIGAGGSWLLRGSHPEHVELEAEAAAFFHCERSIFFGSGYIANFALFSTLLQGDDLVIFDELIHASVREWMRAGRARSKLGTMTLGQWRH